MKIIITSLCLLCSTLVFSQNDATQFWDNVRYGGGFSMAFGSSTLVAVSPSAVYDFNNSFSLGLGLGYIYQKRNDFNSNIFTGSVFGLFNPIPEIQLSGEFEQLFVNRNIGNINDNYNYPALYLGIAYGTRNFSVGLRYDVLFNESKSIYTNGISPIIRIFF